MNQKLEDQLKELNQESGRNIVYDSKEDLFYEISRGQKTKIEFKDFGYDNEDIWLTNDDIEMWLSGPDRKLREIIINHVDEKIKQELLRKGVLVEIGGRVEIPHMDGYHDYWDKKKEILKNKYNITWASPVDENPEILDDLE